MRFTFDMDDTLLFQAKKVTGITAENELVGKALRDLVDAENYKSILEYESSGVWERPENKLERV